MPPHTTRPVPEFAATPLQGRVELSGAGHADLMPDPGRPLARDRPTHGVRVELAVWKDGSARNPQGRLVPYVVTQQPKASRCADARPGKINDIKEIDGSGERT
jgi:hypothetical protein